MSVQLLQRNDTTNGAIRAVTVIGENIGACHNVLVTRSISRPFTANSVGNRLFVIGHFFVLGGQKSAGRNDYRPCGIEYLYLNLIL